jgi:hypothetical protein
MSSPWVRREGAGEMLPMHARAVGEALALAYPDTHALVVSPDFEPESPIGQIVVSEYEGYRQGGLLALRDACVHLDNVFYSLSKEQ